MLCAVWVHHWMHSSSGCDDPEELTLKALDGHCLAAKSITIFFIYFCNTEFDFTHTGIGENRKLLGDDKRTTPRSWATCLYDRGLCDPYTHENYKVLDTDILHRSR